VIELRQGAVNDLPFDILGVIFEARVEIFFDADQLSSCHGEAIVSID
jgi:gamma-glutamyl phosphate reductase